MFSLSKCFSGNPPETCIYQEKVLRFNDNPFTTKALRKTVMHRPKLKNIGRLEQLQKIEQLQKRKIDEEHWKNYKK